MIDVFYVIVAFFSGWFTIQYLDIEFHYLSTVLLALVILVCIRFNRKRQIQQKYLRCVIGIFSFGLSFAIVLGHHIHVEDIYSGTIKDNYILSYGFVDVVALFAIMYGICEIVKRLYSVCLQYAGRLSIQYNQDGEISFKFLLVIALILFVLWLPYLYVYYPGFIFSDTMSSIQQAVGIAGWNNHHPVMYTMFIKVCLKVGSFLGGDNTIGCVIYCISQMLYMSICLSYLLCWLYKRMNIPRVLLGVMIVFYGVTPYFAQMSIAMWKDPVFSVTLVAMTVLLTDVILSRGTVLLKNPFLWGIYIFLALVTIFVRNNGIYIMLFVGFVLLIVYCLKRKKDIGKSLRKLAICTIVILVFSQLITGPLYNKLGIQKETVESYGIFLNQMARVAACQGNMSDEDKEYMDQLLPIELYESTYRPCCVDMLKWDANFNSSVLENGFFERYFSMLLKNPKLFFEGWELQTYGFWTVNCEEINYYPGNIMGGVPRNYYPDYYKSELDTYGIQTGKYVNDPILTKIFPIEDPAIPIGIINWFAIFLIILVIVFRQETLLVALVPTAGLMITLIVASPISYWPRYAAAEQYLVPFYLVLFCYVFKQKIMEKGEK